MIHEHNSFPNHCIYSWQSKTGETYREEESLQMAGFHTEREDSFMLLYHSGAALVI